MPRRILYAEANYEAMVREHGYFIDKTSFIAKLEPVKNPVFLRPRRFGKSLLCRMLECYYNIRQMDEFEELFGATWISRHPTPLPNLNMRQIFVEYFNDLNQIDVSTRYQASMQQFIKDLDLEALFAAYWNNYIPQFPEAIFTQVNENFYRSTFLTLCSCYLSPWFTWNVERSYPQGRSDLEFVGKYHECFAGVRIVIEFKYYSNPAFEKLKVSLAVFVLQVEDTRQIAGYVEGLRQEYPEAQVRQYVIYCVGNVGFRVFEVK